MTEVAQRQEQSKAFPSLHTELMHVTPELAARWLADHNAGNRSISKHIVRNYAAEMAAGNWKLTHQGPAFDDTGRLIDGQHRLAAVVESRVSIPMHVTFGADPETFTVLDIGYKRQAGHLIPGPHSSLKAGAGRWLMHLPRLAYQNSTTNRDIHALASEWSPTLGAAVELSYGVYRTTRINASLHGALLALALTSAAAPIVSEWAAGLSDGAGLTSDDPRLHLRNRWALESRHLNGGNGRVEAAHLLVRAWNAYVNGEGISRLQLPRGTGQKSWPTPILDGKRIRRDRS